MNASRRCAASASKPGRALDHRVELDEPLERGRQLARSSSGAPDRPASSPGTRWRCPSPWPPPGARRRPPADRPSSSSSTTRRCRTASRTGSGVVSMSRSSATSAASHAPLARRRRSGPRPSPASPRRRAPARPRPSPGRRRARGGAPACRARRTRSGSGSGDRRRPRSRGYPAGRRARGPRRAPGQAAVACLALDPGTERRSVAAPSPGRTAPPAALMASTSRLGRVPSRPTSPPRRRRRRCRPPSIPIASSTRSRVSLRRTSAPGFVTTASVPPPNRTAGGQALVELGGAGRGGREVAAQVPALERRAELAGQGRREPADEALGDQLVVAPDVEERRDHRAIDRGAPAARSASVVHASRRTSAGSMPAARQTSASRRSARPRTTRMVGVVPAFAMAPPPRREPGVHRHQPLLGALVGVGDDPFLAARERGPAPMLLPVGEPLDRVVGDRSRQLLVAPRSRARPPSRAHGSAGGPGRSPAGPCRHRGGAPPPRRRLDPRGSPLASIRAARNAATSATARECATNQSGGSREQQESGGIHAPGDGHRLDGSP